MRRLRWLVGILLVTGLVASSPAAAVAASAGGDFPERIFLPNGFQPEGITTGRGTTVFVGSLADGDIWRGDVSTGQGSVFVKGTGEMAVGVEYDRARNLVWVAGGSTGTVRAYDATTGERVATYRFAGTRFLNDLVVTPEAVYVTDSPNPVVAVIPFRANGSLPQQWRTRTVTLGGDYEHVRGAFNGNGIVASDGHLVLVQSTTGLLFRVDPETGVARRIDVGTRLLNGDGLELRGSILYVVRNQNNLVVVLRMGDDLLSGRVIHELTEPTFDVPTTITAAATRLYAVNARFGTTPTPTTRYWITQVTRAADR